MLRRKFRLIGDRAFPVAENHCSAAVERIASAKAPDINFSCFDRLVPGKRLIRASFVSAAGLLRRKVIITAPVVRITQRKIYA